MDSNCFFSSSVSANFLGAPRKAADAAVMSILDGDELNSALCTRATSAEKNRYGNMFAATWTFARS